MDENNKNVVIVRLFFELGINIKHSIRKNFEDAGITLPQSMVISTLMKNGEMKITELSNEIKLSNSTISGIIDRLEKQQMVVRTRSEEDRRSVYVKVTPKVEEIHREAIKKAEKGFEDLLGKGTPEEIDKIIDGLKILKKILNERKE